MNKASDKNKTRVTDALRGLDTTLTWGKALLFLLLLTWACIRVFEAVSRTDILQSSHIYYIGLLAWFLLACFGLQLLVRMIRAAFCREANTKLWWGWFGLFITVDLLIYFHDSFRIIALTFSSLLQGFSETVSQGVYALFRLFPWHPFVLFFTGIDQIIDMGVSGRALRQVGLPDAQLQLIMMIVDIVAVALFFLPGGIRFSSILFAMVAAYVTGAALGLHPSMTLPDGVVLHCLLIAMGCWLAVNIYRTLRGVALQAKLERPVRKLAAPSLMAVLFWVFIAHPLFADLQNHFVLAKSQHTIIAKVSSKEGVAR